MAKKRFTFEEFAQRTEDQIASLNNTLLSHAVMTSAIINILRDADPEMKENLVSNIFSIKASVENLLDQSNVILEQFVSALKHGDPPELWVVPRDPK